MASPEEASFKNILISIRDKPSIVDETITVKRKITNFLTPHTDSVSPQQGPKPKMAYIEKAPSNYIPGKAVKIISDKKQHRIEDEVSDTYSSLDSYLAKDQNDIYQRRVSESNITKEKKRCSTSTIRKLKSDDIKKSKSEVRRLSVVADVLRARRRPRAIRTIVL
ncbi:unnamed protein product [Danaus chrysippus]|uniref:(African queen) hypothetical protein n=1 Tax=Danaus chrysippus TaxID=151541 RepID=A0A8J2QRA8_9NEOP|nr:unnamed protein product [Danaus chrysippus]